MSLELLVSTISQVADNRRKFFACSDCGESRSPYAERCYQCFQKFRKAAIERYKMELEAKKPKPPRKTRNIWTDEFIKTPVTSSTTSVLSSMGLLRKRI